MGAPVKRKKDPQWPALLAKLEREHSKAVFKWGTHDCLTFAADWCRTCTGVDYMKAHRGKYKTAKGAIGVLKRNGAGNLLKTMIDRVGKPIEGYYAQRGDVGAFKARRKDFITGIGLGVVDSSGRWLMVLHPKVPGMKLPISDVLYVWRP